MLVINETPLQKKHFFIVWIDGNNNDSLPFINGQRYNFEEYLDVTNPETTLSKLIEDKNLSGIIIVDCCRTLDIL